jgi:hypothetical protein
MLWDQQVQTDRTIQNQTEPYRTIQNHTEPYRTRQNHTEPYIIIRVNEKATCILIDVAISGDGNVIKIEDEKVLKYKDPTIEIKCMWNVKTSIIE